MNKMYYDVNKVFPNDAAWIQIVVYLIRPYQIRISFISWIVLKIGMVNYTKSVLH